MNSSEKIVFAFIIGIFLGIVLASIVTVVVL